MVSLSEWEYKLERLLVSINAFDQVDHCPHNEDGWLCGGSFMKNMIKSIWFILALSFYGIVSSLRMTLYEEHRYYNHVSSSSDTGLLRRPQNCSQSVARFHTRQQYHWYRVDLWTWPRMVQDSQERQRQGVEGLMAYHCVAAQIAQWSGVFRATKNANWALSMSSDPCSLTNHKLPANVKCLPQISSLNPDDRAGRWREIGVERAPRPSSTLAI